jgi:hypothetical protein
MFERSYLGRRAVGAEPPRAPGRLHRPGGCQEQTVLVTFATTNVTRAKRESLGLDLATSEGRGAVAIA